MAIGTGPHRSSLHPVLNLLRPHYWTKNLLVFVPAFLANAFADPDVALSCAIGFVLMSLCASGTYILNDAVDLSSDRAHASKSMRPLASGTIPLVQGLGVAAVLLFGSIGLSAWWKPHFALLLAGYVVASAAYTFGVKRLLLVDALWLGALHSFRLFCGGAIASVTVSGWLLAFSLMFFFSLALAKRYNEVGALAGANGDKLPGRGYRARDGNLLLSFGASAAAASIVVLALYVTDTDYAARHYSNPSLLWGVVLVVAVWLLHVWGQAHRLTLTDDPVTFALHDRMSLALFVIMLTIMMAAR